MRILLKPFLCVGCDPGVVPPVPAYAAQLSSPDASPKLGAKSSNVPRRPQRIRNIFHHQNQAADFPNQTTTSFQPAEWLQLHELLPPLGWICRGQEAPA